MWPRPRHHWAFTLIELLVVVAIVSLLMSILVPSVQNARKQAQAAVCGSNMQQILLALKMYQFEYQGYIPPEVISEKAWPHYRYGPPIAVQKRDMWFYKLHPVYVPDPNVLICPGDPIRTRFDFEAQWYQYPHMNTRVPSCGYGLNYVLRHFHAHNDPLAKSYNERYGPERPEWTILMAEVGPDEGIRLVPHPVLGPYQPWRDCGRLVWDDGVRPWYSGPPWLTARHLGKIHMASMDGAVHRVETLKVLSSPILPRYDDCIGGQCLFCEENIPHYNFSFAKLWWWAGPYPVYGDPYY